MVRRSSTNEQQQREEEHVESASDESDSEADASSDNQSGLSSGEGDSDASDASSAASNQSSDASETKASPLRGRHQRRSRPRAHRSTQKRRERQQKAAGDFPVTRSKQSSWSARERQFETFRSSFIVLPVPEGVARIEKARGYCLHVKSVVHWVIPESILSSVASRYRRNIANNNSGKALGSPDDDQEGHQEDEDDDEDVLLTLGVHVSLFHAPTKRFFGNTWVSPEVAIDAYRIKPDREPKTNALRYIADSVTLNFRAYFLSEIVDANCVGIVELVAYRKDVDSKATVAAAGCGWTILPLFAQSVGDAAAATRGDNQLSTPFSSAAGATSSGESVGVFTGSPRVLWELQGAAQWQTQPRHAQSKFHYQLQLYDPLQVLGTGGFMRRNELVGALEVIPGLKHGNLAGIDAGTNPKLQLLRDIDSVDGEGDNDGDDEIAAYEEALASFVRMASLVPKTIQVEESFTLNVHALRVFMHMRSEVESNLISRLKLSRKTIHTGATTIEGGHISARVLKLALHNGRCFRTRQHTVPLKVDDDGDASNSGGGDDIMRCAQTAPVRLKGFVFHPYMSVVVSLQFTVHFRLAWPQKLKQQAMESKPKKILPEDDVVTVTMASRVVVPSDGKRLFLYDKDHPAVDADANAAKTTETKQHVLHVDLLSGPTCRPYTENPVYTPPDHVMGASRLTQTKMRESFAFADLVLAVDGGKDAEGNAHGKMIPVEKPKHDPPPAAEHWAKRILAKADANSVLAQTLNALATTTSPPVQQPSSPKKLKEERGTSPVRPSSPVKTKKQDVIDPVPVLSLPAPTPSTELSRASKTLLMRYGFVDAHDTTAVSAAGTKATGTSHVATKKSADATLQRPAKSLRSELEDVYKAHEIRFHFAAFRTVQNSPLSSLPTRMYFTFQFYRFAPTRTETLRLSNAFANPSTTTQTQTTTGKTFLLMRESPANKPSLAIQFDVDTTASQSPLEHREFAGYLLNKQLYVDVWDADSLFLLGTCAIPLHELLRQGAGVKKFQGEVDIWESAAVLDDSSGYSNGGNASNVTDDDGTRAIDLQDVRQPRQRGTGGVMGKLQILLSNYGLKGKNAVASSASAATTATSNHKAPHRERGGSVPVTLTKAKHRVRARPLVDNNAELHRLLTDQGFYGANQSGRAGEPTQNPHQHRKILQARSAGDATTLTPREIDILCELFRANPQASAPNATRIACDRDGKRGLTALLSLQPPSYKPPATQVPPLNITTVGNVPSVATVEDPVVKLREHLKRVLERAVDKGVRIHQVFMDFDASGDGNLSYDELERALAQLGVVTAAGDVTGKAILRQLLRQFDRDGDGNVSYTEFLISMGISLEQNKREVVQTTTVDMETGVREVFQRLQAKGIDIEELFDHFDVDKSGTLEMHEFKKALEQCLQAEGGGVIDKNNVLALLKEDALRALMQRVNKNGDDEVDYHEFLAFCGVVTKTPREDKRKKRALSQAERKLIKLLLRAMRMGMSTKQLFQQFDSNSDGNVSVKEFANSLDMLFQTKSALSEDDIRAITLRFDENGDDSISFVEFKAFVEEIRTAQEQLTKVFQPILNKTGGLKEENGDDFIPTVQWKTKCVKTWRMKPTQVEDVVRWLETVDLIDDKQRVDVQELALLISPSAQQTKGQQHQPAAVKKAMGLRLRDFLNDAVGQGVDARGCFAHFDPDGDGEITAAELKTALRQLGSQFEDATDKAIDAMVDELDADGSGKISFAEFQKLLPASVTTNAAKAATDKPAKPSDEVFVWLTQLLASAVAKGMVVDACFAHFDKDKNGTITRQEFSLAMQELGMDAAVASSGGKSDEALLKQVMDRIDRDGSGEISLVEFKRLFPSTTEAKGGNSAPAKVDKTTKEPERVKQHNSKEVPAVERLRQLLRAAQSGGIAVAQSFAHFDVDKDGSITREEFVTMIKALPGFDSVPDDEIHSVVATLDANASGSISLDEFNTFVNADEGAQASPALTAGGEEKPTSQRVTVGATETQSTSVNENTGDAEPATKGRLQRAGSFSGRPKAAATGGLQRAGTDSETVADEAARSKAGASAPSGRRPSLAETRAAAKKALAEKAATEGGSADAGPKASSETSVTTTEKQGEEEEKKASSQPTSARRPSLAEARAAAKKEAADKEVPKEGTKPTDDASGTTAQASEKPAHEAEKPTPQPATGRRPSLAETRAAARAAKAEKDAKVDVVKETHAVTSTTNDQGAELAPQAQPGKEDDHKTEVPSTSSSGSVATAKETESASASKAESPPQFAGEEKKPSGSVDAVQEPLTVSVKETASTVVAEKVSTEIQDAQANQPGGSSARRPSLAEARAAGRAAAATKPGPAAATTGKPPVAGQRRPSLAETRAAAKAGLTTKAKPASSSPAAPTESAEVTRGLASLQALLLKAQASGVDLTTALSHFDKDENGKLTYDEFGNGLGALGSDLSTLSPEDARAMAKWIDMSAKGHITLQDFEVFVQTPVPTTADGSSSVAVTSDVPMKTQPTPADDDSVKSTTSTALKPTVDSKTRPAPTRQLSARAPKPSETTAAKRTSLSARGQSAFTVAGADIAAASETDVVVAAKRAPIAMTADASTSKSKGATTTATPAATSSSSRETPSKETTSRTEDADPTPPSGYECSYEFHSDPAIRSVEVKLRRAAIDAYARGVFPLRIVQKFLEPPTATSGTKSKQSAAKNALRRVEFLQVLMEIGFSLLSDGGDDDDGDDATDNSGGPRLHDHLYARQLERLARYKHHVKEESRAQKALVRAVHQTQERAHAQQRSKKLTSASTANSSVHRFAQDKSQLLRVLSYYRDGHKKSLVYSLLRDQVTTQLALFPSFAALLFAEMAFVNPYPHQERFRLEFLTTPAVVDADLVKNSDEWRFYRRHLPLAYGETRSQADQDRDDDDVENDMIDPHNEVVLDANDRIAIPLKLRWLQSTLSASSTASKPASTMSLAVRSCTHGHTVALFKMELYAQPFVCHRVLRFVHPATSVWKWTVKCPRGKHLVCLDPSVAAVAETSAVDSASIVTLKCRVGAYPSLEEFYVVLYDDEYFARIDEIWQIRIQSAMRLDVHALLGQTVRSELVIRGDMATNHQPRRHVRCFTTWHHAHHVSFRPAQIFQLVGDAYNRIEWRFCAVDLPAPSLTRVRVHLVDVETNELVGSWLLHVSLGRPAITKSYELELPPRQAAQKKIAYANPWDQPQTIVLRSSDPSRLRPRDSVLQIPPQGQIFLRLVFPVASDASSDRQDESELLLFVNDQQTEQNEECLRFQVRYNY